MKASSSIKGTNLDLGPICLSPPLAHALLVPETCSTIIRKSEVELQLFVLSHYKNSHYKSSNENFLECCI